MGLKAVGWTLINLHAFSNLVQRIKPCKLLVPTFLGNNENIKKKLKIMV